MRLAIGCDYLPLSTPRRVISRATMNRTATIAISVSEAAHARSTSNALDDLAPWKMNSGSDDWLPENGFVLMKKLLPATSSTGAVSPVTRAIASITPVTMPLDAVGSTMRTIVFHFATPRAYEAPRSALGTRHSL